MLTLSYWKIWPSDGSWIEVSLGGDTVGEMHYGSIAEFRDKHLHKNNFLPKNHSKKWSKEEKDLLLKLIKLDETIPEIAKMLGRSRRSVVAKSAVLLGVNMNYVRVKEGDLNLTIMTLISIVKSETTNIVAALENE